MLHTPPASVAATEGTSWESLFVAPLDHMEYSLDKGCPWGSVLVSLFFRPEAKAIPVQTKSCWSVQIWLGCNLEKAAVLILKYCFSPVDLVCKVELGLQTETLCRQIKKPSLLQYYRQIMRSFRSGGQYQHGRKRQLKSHALFERVGISVQAPCACAWLSQASRGCGGVAPCSGSHPAEAKHYQRHFRFRKNLGLGGFGWFLPLKQFARTRASVARGDCCSAGEGKRRRG